MASKKDRQSISFASSALFSPLAALWAPASAHSEGQNHPVKAGHPNDSHVAEEMEKLKEWGRESWFWEALG